MSKYLILLTIAIAVGCGGSDGGDSGVGGDDGTGGTAGEGGSGGTVNTGGSGGTIPEPEPVIVENPDGTTRECFPIAAECGDCVDNDGDGFVDSDDPYCLGPFDNKESDDNLGTGVGGEGAENCKADCYFDDGGGSGNDTCAWNHKCDPETPMTNCAYTPDSNFCSFPEFQTDLCYAVCEPITPNGCDCFGCCEIAGEHVFLGTENGDIDGNCTLDNPGGCAACTPQASCFNPLGECELGIGQTELPETCEVQRCENEAQPCGLEGDASCTSGTYCVTGCCVEVVVQ